MIHITVSGTEIYGKLDTKLTSGSVGREVEFTFDEGWNGLSKTAVFRVGDDCRSYYIREDNVCDFPWELLTHDKVGQIIHIGVCGMKDEEIVFPTMYTYIGELAEGANPGADPSIEHSPELVEQLISVAENAEDVAQSVRDDADAGKFNGSDYVLTPEDKQEIADMVSGGTITVDQTYNSESPNAQSGIAVEQALTEYANSTEFEGRVVSVVSSSGYATTEQVENMHKALIEKDLAEVKVKRVEFSNYAIITAQDNTEYIATEPITNLVITYPENDFICSFNFTLASEGDISVTIDESNYIGGAPSFANGETWELNIKNGIVAAGKVV